MKPPASNASRNFFFLPGNPSFSPSSRILGKDSPLCLDVDSSQHLSHLLSCPSCGLHWFINLDPILCLAEPEQFLHQIDEGFSMSIHSAHHVVSSQNVIFPSCALSLMSNTLVLHLFRASSCSCHSFRCLRSHTTPFDASLSLFSCSRRTTYLLTWA